MNILSYLFLSLISTLVSLFYYFSMHLFVYHLYTVTYSLSLSLSRARVRSLKALRLSDLASATFSNCTFIGNAADKKGGGKFSSLKLY